MKTDVTPQEIETEVRAIAEANPDFEYEAPIDDGENVGCVYFNADGTPSCLIGHGLSRLGFVAEDFSEDGSNGMAISELLLLWQDTPSDTCCWLGDVQTSQDEGDTWSYAVKYADKRRSIREQAF